ncbi:hypothetical protein CTEN210_18623 [Chaetoceros tenuissimus]|uniref:Uncharacterized protein n=1 Tax=Chaetoceros tenuissimus TaxID=426638 RepID=A0AAD3HFM2_9STRA|nr:hypothetical protein CTEN210_18623 [Chaetoceros tenuissimus]
MTPHPAIDISSKDILFPKGQDLNDLLRQNVQNPNFAGNYAQVSAKISSLVEMGPLPVAFIDHESKKICVSVAHFKPDDLEYRLVATLNLESSLLETRLFDLKGKESPSFFLNNLRYKDLIKGSFEAVDKIRISTKSTNDESLAAISAIALPVSLIPILSSVSYPIDPKIFLEKISLFLRDSNVTMTEKKNFRKVSDHVLDLFTFAASACLIEKDSLDSGCVKFTALEEVPEITLDRLEKFLKAVDYKITLEEDDYHNQLSEEEEEVESDDIYSRKSSRSIPLSSINDSPPAENKAETPAIEKLSKILLTGLVNQQENRIVVNSSSTHILEKENKEDLKEELLYFQSKDGENPETVVDPVTMKFYKNTVSGMAASLNKNSENSRVTPEGISIFGLKPRKEGGLKTANLEGLSEAVVKATLSDDQLKSLVTTKIELPESVFHLLELLKMFKVLLRTFAGPESYILRQYSSFLAEIQELQVDVHRLFEDEGDVFILSLIQAINTEVASFVNRCTKHKVIKISFDPISDHIRKGTFMNNCRISIPTLAQSSNSLNNSSNNSSSKSHKRKPQGNDTQIPGKRLKILVSSPYPDLVWNEWKTRANQQVRNQNGIHLPQMRNRTICPRFYFEGNCIHEKCVNSRGHFINLSSAEKSQIIALKNKCIECTNQAKMDPVQVLFDDFHMKSKYDSESEKVPLTKDEENCIQKEELSKPKEEKDDEEKATPHEEKVLKMIQKILNTPSPSFKESPFIFENTRKARIHNSKIIEKFDFDFKAAMESMERFVIHPGSKFRESELLEPLLRNHPDWEILKEIMDLGVDLGLDPSKTRDEATRLKDFEEALKKGNSGTMKDKLAQETVAKNQEKEVRYGRTIPITIECARQLKNGSLTPLGCAVQWTIKRKMKK